MHLLGGFLSPFKLICCILFITEVFDTTTALIFAKAYSYGWWDILFCETEEKMASPHRHGLMLMLTMIMGSIIFACETSGFGGRKEGTEFAVNAKIISGVLWRKKITATRKTFATLVCETAWTNYTSDRWIGLDVDDDKLGGFNFACETSGFGGRKEGTEFAPKQPTINHSQNFNTHNWRKYLSTAKMMIMVMQMLLLLMVF